MRRRNSDSQISILENEFFLAKAAEKYNPDSFALLHQYPSLTSGVKVTLHPEKNNLRENKAILRPDNHTNNPITDTISYMCSCW